MSETYLSKLNSTTTPLSGSQEWVGGTDVMSAWSEIDINAWGSPSDAAGTLYFEFSPDGVNWDVSVPLVTATPIYVPLTLRVVNKFFRVRYVNGPTDLTTFRLSTLYHKTTAMRLTRFLSQSIDPNEPIEIVRVAKSELPIGAATSQLQEAILGALTASTLTVSGTVEVHGIHFPDQQRVLQQGTVGVSGSVTTTASISSQHTTQNLTASLSSQVALDANPDRLGASFFNTFGSKGNLFISLGTLASTGSFLAAVRPGGYYSLDTVTSEPISFVFDQVPGNVMVTEQS